MAAQYPPGPKGQILFGSLWDFNRRRLEFLVECARDYGDIVHARIGLKHFYILNHPDYIHQVLVKEPEKFEKGPQFKRNTRQSIGQGLITSEGDFHKRQRRLVQPAFHHKRIEAYAGVMVDYTQRQMSGWHEADSIDIHHEMMTLTMQIIASTMFDADVSNDAKHIGEAITLGIEAVGQRVLNPLHLPDWIPTPQNRRRRHAAEVVENAMMSIINARRASGEDTGDLLSMLLLAVDEDDGGQMTNQQVRDETMTLFIAGHETTANALSWALYLLGQHPEVEAKLVAELNTALAGRAPTMKDLASLPYTDQVVKETMRLYPPVWAMSRLVVAPFKIADYPIDAGNMLVLSPYAMHRDPRYFPQPEKFMPERFAPGYEDRIPRYAYFPFGGGPRICIGNSFAMMEATLVLATLMQRYHLAPVSDAPVTPEPLVTLRPKGGIFMRAVQREPQPTAAVMG